jgi:hypothetical protein
LAVRLSFCGAGGFEAYGGGTLVVVEGDAAIPGVLGHNAVYLLAGFLCFCWLKLEEDEEVPSTVQKHSRAGYNLAALLFFFLSLVAQLVYWSRIVSGLNQEHA